MASPNVYPSGLGGTGPVLATYTNDYFVGATYWVDTVKGNDSNAGTDRVLPKATLLSAFTACSANDTICIESGSAESIGTAYTFNKAFINVIGFGSGANRPRYTCTAGINLFTCSALGIRFHNLYFPASTGASTARISTTSSELEVDGCYFECGANDTTASVVIGSGANDCRVLNTTFAVTAARPAIGLSVTSAVGDLRVDGCTFDGGSYGWTDYAFKISAAAVRSYISNITLANKSHIGLTASGQSYKLFGINTSGAEKVVISA